jgi:hypothetical protein
MQKLTFWAMATITVIALTTTVVVLEHFISEAPEE